MTIKTLNIDTVKTSKVIKIVKGTTTIAVVILKVATGTL